MSLFVCRASAGTGKTFNLAAYYIALLLSGDSYRSILALTFTNKATAEMQERILTHLYLIAHRDPEEDGFLSLVTTYIHRLERPEVPTEQLYARAEACFEAILHDYDGMRVTTIDAFLQLLLSGMASALGQYMGFEINLDHKRMIIEAVDRILTTHIDAEQGLRESVTAYVEKRLEGNENWDARAQLVSLAEEIYKEAVQRDAQEWDESAILALKNLCDWESNQTIQRVWSLEPKFKEPNSSGEYFQSVKNILKSTKKRLSAAEYDELEYLLPKARTICVNAILTSNYLDNMLLLGFIRRQIGRDLNERNQLLLAETARMLSEALKPQDADFILEKAGLRYNHILLDEFQDTSTLQWANILPLISEMLSSGGTAFVVGDTKQGIYRWRSGDWHIMESLGTDEDPLRDYFKPLSLVRNFRTCERIIHHNLETMLMATGLEDNKREAPIFDEGYNGANMESYCNLPSHAGGYVRMRAFPYFGKPADVVCERIVEDMWGTIYDLMDAGAKPDDFVILIRYKTDANLIIEGNTRAVPLTSADSFLLSSSQSVQCVVSALRYMATGDVPALAYLTAATGTDYREALANFDRTLPLYEMTEQIIRLCLCDERGKFGGTDLAYLNAFCDKLRAYITSYGSSVMDFICHWDDVMSKEAITAPDTSSVRIMTIHASKGLEARYLFIPFCDWMMAKSRDLLWTPIAPEFELEQSITVPILNGKKAADSSYRDVCAEENRMQRRDNLNLLYVALTRAKEGLFLSAALGCTKASGLPDSVASILIRTHDLETKALDLAARQPMDGETWTPSDLEYVEYEDGQFPVPDTKTATTKAANPVEREPFSMRNAESIASHYYADNRNIRFQQSQDSLRYYQEGDVGRKSLDSAAFGIICHDILSRMVTVDDLSRTLRGFRRRGVIDSDDMQHQIEELILSAFSIPEMADWFSGRYTLLREQTIATAFHGQVMSYRPDRVMIDGEKAIVLDYKFGAMHQADYVEQVRGYMRLLMSLGYTPSGYLWMARTNSLVPVELD